MKKINLEEILWQSFHDNGIPKPTHTLAEITQKAVKEALKEACRQVLELAAENATITSKTIIEDFKEPPYMRRRVVDVVEKGSILNTINQIE